MSFLSKNEVDKFDYTDCICHSFGIIEGNLVLELEALIVKAKNSQNANYTDSYADGITLTVKDANIKRLVKSGYDYYDSNDNLIESVPDEELNFSLWDWNKFSKVFLPEFNIMGENEYCFVFEMPDDEPGAITDTYELYFSCSEVFVNWERYLNRVQY